MTTAALLNIGDELLIGQTINTNASWLGSELKLVNINVVKGLTISDQKKDIIEALDYLLPQVDIVLITGGLGPTKDDITKYTLSGYFNMPLKRNKEIEEKIELFFKQRSRDILEVNRMQADLPEGAIIIENKQGTASGMWFEKNNKVVVSMPGVPYEMKGMISETVIPLLVKKYSPTPLYHRTILTQGIGESFLAEVIKDWEENLRNDNLSLAYLPSPGIVKLRISGSGNDLNVIQSKIEKYIGELKILASKWIFGEGEDKLEEIVGKLLLRDKNTLSTAESCTGGYISHLITSVSGSSSYYMGSVISYDNRIKMEQLNVSIDTLKSVGAVSQETVEQMAVGVKVKLKTDYSIAVSGIAGPDGGTEEKPVGTVWIAIGHPDGVYTKKFIFENNRERNIRRTALTALNLLRKIILKEDLN